MATQLPIFPNATSLFVHSGNILNWDRLKKRPLQTPKDEVKIVILILESFKNVVAWSSLFLVFTFLLC